MAARSTIPSWLVGGLALAAACGFAVTSARACDTPVYRYAMYRWKPAPYELYVFHQKPLGPAATALRDAVDTLSRDEVSPANLTIVPISLADADALDRLPRDVRAMWERLQNPGGEAKKSADGNPAAEDKPGSAETGSAETGSGKEDATGGDDGKRTGEQPAKQTGLGLPAYLLVNPPTQQGVSIQVAAGQLGDVSQDVLAAMIDSPARRRIAKSLGAGAAGVFVVLHGDDPKRNAEVDNVVAELVKDLAAGKVNLNGNPLTEPAGGDNGTSDGEEKADKGGDKNKDDKKDKNKLDVGIVTVARNSAEEQWLVRSLLAVEGDLREIEGPMVFAAYGRGRVLPPYLRTGITRDNLLGCLEFITGACSCTVKDQNPGVDLLIKHDWETAAAAVAEKFGAEEGNENQLGANDFFPELIIPAASGDGSTPDGTGGDEPKLLDLRGTETGTDVPTTGPSEDKADGQTDPAAKPATTEDAGPAVADSSVASVPAAKTPPASEVGGLGRWTGMLAVAGGLVTGLVVLFVATFFVLRPR